MMKKIFAVAAILSLFLIPHNLFAQMTSGIGATLQNNTSSASSNGNPLAFPSPGFPIMIVQASGTFSGAAFTMQGSLDNTNWNTLTCWTMDSASSIGASGITAAGMWRCNTSGISIVRAAIASGTPGGVTILANAIAGGQVRDNQNFITTTAILDSNAFQVIKFGATTSAVNQVTVTDSATGNGPILSATGTDATINLNLLPKSTGFVQLGTNDAAAPAAQILGIQGVVAGTSNTAGSLLTIQGSKGTGTGVGGNIALSVAYPSTTGTTQNSEVAVVTLNGTNAGSSGTTNLISFTPTIAGTSTNAYNGLLLNVTETTQGSGVGQLIVAQVGGTQRFGITDGLAAVGTRIRLGQATAPTVTAGSGSSPTVTGTDSAGIVFVGTGSPSGAQTVTFNGTWEAAPACTVTAITTAANYVTKAISTTTTLIFSTAAGPSASDKYAYICVGTQ